MNGESVPRLVEAFFEPMRRFLDFTFAVGVTYGVSRVVSVAWRCWRGFRVYCLPFGRCTRCDLKERFGEWAVIVGATSGIGLAYAEELARRKMNVVLISKSYDDLLQLVANLQSEYSVQAYGIHADFSLGRHVFQEIDDALKGFEIGILVNSVTVQYDHPQFFVLVPPQRLMQILDMNITSTTVMTYMLLPQMLERKRGAIINVCSQVSCLSPSPLMTAYTASMMYVKSFSECLKHESEKRGVIVQTVLPGCIATPSSRHSTLFTPSPVTYVTHALNTLGVASNTCGYWPHSIQMWLCSCVPCWLWVWLVSHLFRRQRLQSINEAKEQGIDQFSRRRCSSVVGMATQTGGTHWPLSSQPVLRRVSGGLGLTLRRSPSPKRKVSMATPSAPSTSVATPFRPLGSFPLHPVARDDRIQGQPLASIPSPIPESPSCTSSQFFPPAPKSARNYPTTFNTSTPISNPTQGVAGNIVPPKISLSSSSAPGSDAIHQRHHLPIRHSRVMVIPSVARRSRRSLDTLPTTPNPAPTTTAYNGGDHGNSNHGNSNHGNSDKETTADRDARTTNEDTHEHEPTNTDT